MAHRSRSIGSRIAIAEQPVLTIARNSDGAGRFMVTLACSTAFSMSPRTSASPRVPGTYPPAHPLGQLLSLERLSVV